MLIHPVRPRRVVRREALGSPAFPALFDELRRGLGAAPATAPAAFVPRVDVIESDASLRLVAELPGLADGDFQVIVDSDVITLKGEKRIERPEEGGKCRRVERATGEFSRSFRAPFDVDPGAVTAALENGVLTVTVPKPAEDQPRAIPITTA